ncbi:unnamed protein product, partial [Mesorhabditis belari]|uniref:Uncharacterized protein n=1 Tax=Mesorhabditis belari TaxID=2138241 RepID=A0AAF3FQS1_9BILA
MINGLLRGVPKCTSVSVNSRGHFGIEAFEGQLAMLCWIHPLRTPTTTISRRLAEIRCRAMETDCRHSDHLQWCYGLELLLQIDETMSRTEYNGRLLHDFLRFWSESGTPVRPAAGAPDDRSPIACYSGLGINNIVLTDANSVHDLSRQLCIATFSTSLQGQSLPSRQFTRVIRCLSCATLGTNWQMQHDSKRQYFDDFSLAAAVIGTTALSHSTTDKLGLDVIRFHNSWEPRCPALALVSPFKPPPTVPIFSATSAPPDYLCDTLPKMHDQCVALLTTPFVEDAVAMIRATVTARTTTRFNRTCHRLEHRSLATVGLLSTENCSRIETRSITCRGQVRLNYAHYTVARKRRQRDTLRVRSSDDLRFVQRQQRLPAAHERTRQWMLPVDGTTVLTLTKTKLKLSRGDMQCFVGFALEGSKNGTYGSTGSCDGQCASVQTTVNSVNTWFFFCATNRVCDGLNMTNDCDTLFNSNGRFIKACCCSDSNNCNISNAHVVETKPQLLPQLPQRYRPLLVMLVSTSWANSSPHRIVIQTCFGECASFTYASTFNDQTVRATIFSCDPVALCSQFGLDGTCATVGQIQECYQADSSSTVISGCCCGSDDCLDTSTGLIKPQVSTSKQCFVGLSVTGPAYNGTYGEPGRCDGQCGSIETSDSYMTCVGSCASVSYSTSFMNTSYTTTVFSCDPVAICAIFGQAGDGCGTLIPDDSTTIGGCCCSWDDCIDTSNGLIKPVPKLASQCFVGLAATGPSYNGSCGELGKCDGQCGTIITSSFWVSYTTSLMNNSVTATVFSCDPVAICSVFGQVGDGCGKLYPDNSTTIGGCCCSWDDCIDKTNGMIKPPPTPQGNNQCFVGFSLAGPVSNVTYGQSVTGCDGQCGTMSSSVNGHNAYAFFCASNTLCGTLSLVNTCRNIKNDANQPITGCCCNNGDNCNINNQQVLPGPTGVPTTAPGTTPIACFSGMSLGVGNTSALVTPDNSYQACFGSCSSLSLTTVFSNYSVSATVFSCDPVSVCNVFQDNGKSCGTFDADNVTSVAGCCCSWDDCIDKTNGMIKPPPTPQGNNQCFVGFSLVGPVSNVTYGQSVTGCDGQCGTMSSSVNGHNAYAFFCASNTLCGSLSLVNTCRNIKNDANQPITGCCCNSGDNCNIKNQQVLPGPTGVPTTAPGTPPIACFSGMSLGIGNTSALVTPDNSYQACFGSCSSLSLMTVFSNYSVSATVFSCDPVSVCNVFQDNGKSCGTFDADNVTSVAGCCCGWNDCIDKTNGQIRTTTAPPESATKSSSYPSFLIVLALSLTKILLA